MKPPTDDIDIDPRLDAHLRRTLQAVADTVDPDEIAVTPLRSRRRYVLAAAAVVLAVGAVVLQPFGSQDDPGWTAAAMEFAESAPRLLITADGWAIDTAEEYGPKEGEMRFAGVGRELSMGWGSDGKTFDYDVRVFELEEIVPRLPDVTVGGRTFAVFQYSAEEYAVLWREDGYGIELRGVFPSLDEFLAVVGSVEQVDTQTWLAAMPPVLVQADARAAAIDEMLADIPVPDGFDRSRLDRFEGAVTSRYLLGVDVTDRVACVWIEEWVEATEAGDNDRRQEAIDAMATSREWKVLIEMTAEGEWSQDVWAVGDALANDGFDAEGRYIHDSGLPGSGCGRD